MNQIFVLVLIIIATTTGDYALKLASGHGRLLSVAMIAGILLYALPAFGWMFLMKSQSLAQIGVIYSAASILILFGLSLFVFREEVSRAEFLGAALALGAILVMRH